MKGTRGTPGGRPAAAHWLIVVAALVALVANYAYLRAQDRTVPAAVATVDLPVGHPIDRTEVGTVDVRVDDELEALLMVPDEFDGTYLTTRPVAAGTLLFRSDVDTSLPGGRTMSFPVKPERAVGGALRVGDRIDIIHAADGTARYLLTGIDVVDVNSGSEGQLGAGDYVITVSVADGEALALAGALTEGEITVVRSTGAPPVDVPEGTGP